MVVLSAFVREFEHRGRGSVDVSNDITRGLLLSMLSACC